MTTKFGWCFGPEGARVPHEQCPGSLNWPEPRKCSCSCHHTEGVAA